MIVSVTHLRMCQQDTSLISNQTMYPIQESNTWKGYSFHEEQAYEVWSQSHDFLKNVTHTRKCVNLENENFQNASRLNTNKTYTLGNMLLNF